MQIRLALSDRQRFTSATQTQTTLIRTILIILILGASVARAEAYAGPIIDSGTMFSVLGVLGGLFMLLVGAVWYPAKRAIRAIRTFFEK